MGCANGRDEKTTQDGELTKERQLSRKSTVKQAQDKADYSLKKSENKEDLLNSLVENWKKVHDVIVIQNTKFKSQVLVSYSPSGTESEKEDEDLWRPQSNVKAPLNIHLMKQETAKS